METWDVRALAIEPHQPQVLRSDAETRAIALVLPAGEELQEHQVHEHAYLIVLEGTIELSGGGRTERGGPGFQNGSGGGGLGSGAGRRAPHRGGAGF